MRVAIGCVAILVAAMNFVPAAAAQGNPYYDACKTFGGTYEERRTNCEPECETTYICRFSDSEGRMCDDQGNC